MGVRFELVKSTSVLSRDQVLRLRMELNLGDREIKGDCFFLVFDSSKISAMFLFCRGDIVKILCSRWIHS